MTLKQKLIANAAVTSCGIAVIACISLVGMQSVRQKLHVLTEQSTPYQLQVYEHQRLLQEHIATLLRFGLAATTQEHATTSQQAAKSLSDVEKASEALSALKGEPADSDQAQALRNITAEIERSSMSRITANAELQKSLAAIDSSLSKVTAALRSVDRNTKSSQQRMTTEIGSANTSYKQSTARIKAVQATLGLLNETKLALTELVAAEANEEVASVRSRLEGSIRNLGDNNFVKNERDTKIGKGLSDLHATIQKTALSQCDAVAASLDPRDDTKRAKALAEVARLTSAVNKQIKVLTELIDSASQTTAADGKRLDTALDQSITASATLAKTGDLVAAGSELRALSRALFAARSLPELDSAKQEIASLLARVDSLCRNLRRIPGIDTVSAGFRSIENELLSDQGSYRKKVNLVHSAEQAAQASEQLKQLAEKQKSAGDEGVNKARTSQAQAIGSVNRQFRFSLLFVLTISCGIFLAAILFSRHLFVAVMKPLESLSRCAASFGSGDFSTQLDVARKDEFGAVAAGFNEASRTLTETIAGLKDAVRQMGNTVTILTSSASTIDQVVQTQAELTQESSTAIEQMSVTAADMAQSSSTTARLTAHTQANAHKGRKAVGDSVTSIQDIASAVSLANEAMERLSEQSEQVSDIITTINDIADQTNLLALNAAIEAARAGEAGRGFAVVADEVRALATRTTDSTREIGIVIAAMQNEVTATRTAVDEGKRKVSQGVELAGNTQESLDAIVSSCDSSTQMVTQIATAVEEQAATAAEVAKGVGAISSLSKQARDAGRQVSEATRALDVIAADLQQRSAWFK